MIYAIAKKLKKNDEVVVKATQKRARVQKVDKDKGNYILVHTEAGVFYNNELE